jgi:hypothetical protein
MSRSDECHRGETWEYCQLGSEGQRSVIGSRDLTVMKYRPSTTTSKHHIQRNPPWSPILGHMITVWPSKCPGTNHAVSAYNKWIQKHDVHDQSIITTSIVSVTLPYPRSTVTLNMLGCSKKKSCSCRSDGSYEIPCWLLSHLNQTLAKMSALNSQIIFSNTDFGKFNSIDPTFLSCRNSSCYGPCIDEMVVFIWLPDSPDHILS